MTLPSVGPLDGVRVVDLTTTFMGPYCTLQMARLGADVIKVEEPSGDLVRGIMDSHGNGLGPIFLAANTGKRSIALDLKEARGRDALLRLVQDADVFITNMRPAALARLNITPEVIRQTNPACVVTSLVGFASGGRYAGLAAYDDVIQAASGLADTQGGDGPPEYVRSAVADKTVGLIALNAVLASLLRRARTGHGELLEVPMYECMVAFNVLDHLGGHTWQPPIGPTGYPRLQSPSRKPYRTQDGYLAVVVYTDRMWLSFFDMIGRPELKSDPRYSTIRGRTEHIDELYALVESQMPQRSSQQWLELLSAAGIPAIPVNSIASLLDDPHLADVGFFEHVDHPVEGAIVQPSFPVSFDGQRLGGVRPAPLLGEDSREIAAELGISTREVDDMISNGVLGAPERQGT